MSKVHEALKRAEEERARRSGQERNRSTTTQLSADHTEPTVGSNHHSTLEHPPEPRIAGGSITREASSPKTTIASQIKPAFLRFEDLLSDCLKPVWLPDPSQHLFQDVNEALGGAEQFRTLRSRLYGLRETLALRKVLITSALAGEGKTFVALNLAVAISRETERKVLLIDADLRRPRLHSCLGAPSTPGLTEYLLGQTTEAEIIQQGDEASRLCFIGAGGGTKNPSELLSSGNLEKLLQRVAVLFDWVIIDSPPCLPVADANVLAGMSDGVLLVVKAKSTPTAALLKARKELSKRNVVGVVLNSVEDLPAYVGYPYKQDYISKGK